MRDIAPATVVRAVSGLTRMPMLPPARDAGTSKALGERVASRLGPAVRELNKMVAAFGRERLPQIFEELVRYRVPHDMVEALRALRREGHDEGEIVRVFLEALRPLALRLNASRALVRALRRDFTWSGRRRALQRRVAAVVATALRDAAADRESVA